MKVQGNDPAASDSSRDGDGLDFVDLGETPIRGGVQVDPRAVTLRGRLRPDPRAVLLAGLVVVALAIASAGPLAPHPVASASPSASAPVAAGSPSASADPCTTTLANSPLPLMTLKTPNVLGIHAASSRTTDAVDGVGFSPPVDQTLEVAAGYRMWAVPGDIRCVDSIRIDLHGTAEQVDQALSINPVTPLSNGRGFAFFAPTSGDWTVRVSIRLTVPARAAAPWAVYFFRLNVGSVAYEAPQPSGAASTPQEALVTPAATCAPPDTASASPPAVDLVLADGTTVPGAFGDYTWRGVTKSSNPDLSAVEPVDVAFDGPLEIRIAGNACAIKWHIAAGAFGDTSRPLEPSWTWADFVDNPTSDPRVAAQNVFAVPAIARGDSLVRASLNYPGGGVATVFWRVRVGPFTMPVARLTAPGGEPAELVAGCGVSLELGSGTSTAETCGPQWLELPDGPTLVVGAGTLLRLDVPGWVILNWTVDYTSQNLIVSSGFNPEVAGQLVGGYSSLGLQSVEVPAPPVATGDVLPPSPPPGAWSIRAWVSARHGGDTYNVPFFIRMTVTP